MTLRIMDMNGNYKTQFMYTTYSENRYYDLSISCSDFLERYKPKLSNEFDINIDNFDIIINSFSRDTGETHDILIDNSNCIIRNKIVNNNLYHITFFIRHKNEKINSFLSRHASVRNFDEIKINNKDNLKKICKFIEKYFEENSSEYDN